MHAFLAFKVGHKHAGKEMHAPNPKLFDGELKA